MGINLSPFAQQFGAQQQGINLANQQNQAKQMQAVNLAMAIADMRRQQQQTQFNQGMQQQQMGLDLEKWNRQKQQQDTQRTFQTLDRGAQAKLREAQLGREQALAGKYTAEAEKARKGKDLTSAVPSYVKMEAFFTMTPESYNEWALDGFAPQSMYKLVRSEIPMYSKDERLEIMLIMNSNPDIARNVGAAQTAEEIGTALRSGGAAKQVEIETQLDEAKLRQNLVNLGIDEATQDYVIEQEKLKVDKAKVDISKTKEETEKIKSARNKINIEINEIERKIAAGGDILNIMREKRLQLQSLLDIKSSKDKKNALAARMYMVFVPAYMRTRKGKRGTIQDAVNAVRPEIEAFMAETSEGEYEEVTLDRIESEIMDDLGTQGMLSTENPAPMITVPTKENMPK